MTIEYYPASRMGHLDADDLTALRRTGELPVIINDVYMAHRFRPERIQILYGGSGSGKSDWKATELLLKCLLQPYCRVMFCRKTHSAIRDSQFALFKDLIKRYALAPFFTVNEDMRITCTLTGNLLFARGLDDVSKITSVQDVTDIWIEEPIPKDNQPAVTSSDFTELNRRLRSPKASNHLHLTFNPISDQSWINDYFFKSDLYKPFKLKTTYLDNYFTPPNEAEQYEILRIKKPDEYEVYALGNWGKLKRGLVFPEYKIIPEMPQDLRKRGYGLDWGFYPDPTALIDCGWKEGGLYADELIYQQSLTSGSRADLMKRNGVSPKVQIVADNNPEAIAELRMKGYPNIIAAVKGPGSIKAGLDQMKEYQLFITARSLNLKTELDNYAWEVDNKSDLPTGEPMDKYNHLIDAWRYWFSKNLHRQVFSLSYS